MKPDAGFDPTLWPRIDESCDERPDRVPTEGRVATRVKPKGKPGQVRSCTPLPPLTGTAFTSPPRPRARARGSRPCCRRSPPAPGPSPGRCRNGTTVAPRTIPTRTRLSAPMNARWRMPAPFRARHRRPSATSHERLLDLAQLLGRDEHACVGSPAARYPELPHGTNSEEQDSGLATRRVRRIATRVALLRLGHR
jgi:hypothetical protein